jgi:hypothetical protein
MNISDTVVSGASGLKVVDHLHFLSLSRPIMSYKQRDALGYPAETGVRDILAYLINHTFPMLTYFLEVHFVNVHFINKTALLTWPVDSRGIVGICPNNSRL